MDKEKNTKLRSLNWVFKLWTFFSKVLDKLINPLPSKYLEETNMLSFSSIGVSVDKNSANELRL